LPAAAVARSRATHRALTIAGTKYPRTKLIKEALVFVLDIGLLDGTF
jgi:hypothetical protein